MSLHFQANDSTTSARGPTAQRARTDDGASFEQIGYEVAHDAFDRPRLVSVERPATVVSNYPTAVFGGILGA